jgi:membrane carboxypeptidase/penicillin-binding protein PbpC
VGSSGDLSDAQEVDGVTAMRQAGSTLKPFLYAQALAERRLTAASLLDDSAASISTAAGLYIPQNYDHQFKGWVSTRTALGASLNVPAVRALVMVSPEAMARTLKAAGLPLRESGDYYGYSLALGSAEVPLLGLANAYRTLANGGRYAPVRWMPAAALPSVQAIDPTAAFIVGDILSDPNARARTFGTDSILATRMWTAVKTGTSKDMRDNWAVGWSSRYTVGVWVGNASGAPMHDVSGTSGAAPVWAAVMRHLHQKVPEGGRRANSGQGEMTAGRLLARLPLLHLNAIGGAKTPEREVPISVDALRFQNSDDIVSAHAEARKYLEDVRQRERSHEGFVAAAGHRAAGEQEAGSEVIEVVTGQFAQGAFPGAAKLPQVVWRSHDPIGVAGDQVKVLLPSPGELAFFKSCDSHWVLQS